MQTVPVPVLALCLIAFTGGGGAPVWAADPDPAAQGIAEVAGSGPLETTITVEKLEVREGTTGQEVRRWIPADRLNAGDEVHYTVRVRNGGKQPVDSIVVTKRLPFGVKYLRDSATAPAAQVQFSIDGGRTFATPEALSRAAGDGRKASRKALEGEYTHVRWVLSKPLRPASTALLRFRATFT
jgi:uncharacterized repeat protein (TIGR01451 family)